VVIWTLARNFKLRSDGAFLGTGGLSHGFLCCNPSPAAFRWLWPYSCICQAIVSSHHQVGIIHINQPIAASSMEPEPDAQHQGQQAISKRQMMDFFQRLRKNAGLTAVMDFSCCSA
jgi:hypothetical protein